jgi:hypothetical protein
MGFGVEWQRDSNFNCWREIFMNRLGTLSSVLCIVAMTVSGCGAPLNPVASPEASRIGRHAQGPSYTGKAALERAYFTVTRGHNWNQHLPKETAYPERRGLGFTVHLRPHSEPDKDECLPAVIRASSSRLPLYDATVGGMNICKGEEYDTTYDDFEGSCQDPDDYKGMAETAVVLPGFFENGVYVRHDDARCGADSCFSVSCISGVLAKCAHWGYLPWAAHDGHALGDYFTACVYAARAEYVRGTSFTCDETVFDIFDDIGIQRLTGHRDYRLEAWWNSTGMACSDNRRYTDDGAGPAPPPLQQR